MPRRPIIGVSCYREAVDRDPWRGQVSAVLPAAYLVHLERAGALPVVLPPRADADLPMAREVLARLDGLVLAGGADVEATRYAAAPHATSQAPRPDRDAWELALAQASLDIGLPTLGICRGMQIMAVAAGARLEQHVPDRVGHEDHSPSPGVYASHIVQPVAGTQLADIIGPERRSVPTYHHQAVDPHSLEGTAYLASAWHDDGTLEAMDHPAAAFRVAVQWHPEAGEDPRLFEALVMAARTGDS